MANRFLARFDDEPVFMHPEKHNRFSANLTSLDLQMSADWQREMAATNDNDDFWFADGDWRSMLRPYKVVDGILMIPVKGVLLHEFGYQFFDLATGYVYIEQAVKRGLADDNVKGIALVINSPGGEVAGCFPCGDKIFAARGEKPIRAFAADHAYSAAMLIATSASKITVVRTGGVGSIGVVTSHVDASKMMDDWGLKVTFIYAGKHKVDGNPYEALKPEVKERIQTRIDDLYGIFVAAVARNRDMSEDAVRATEALTYSAPEAVSIGLADDIGNLDDSIAAYAVELALEDGEDQMAGENNKDGATSVDVEKVKAESHAAGKAEGLEAGRKEGANAERERVNAILGSEEGKKRPKAALSAALKTDMSVEQASAFLADLAEEAPAAATEKQTNDTASGFVQVMNGQPKVDLGVPGEQDSATTEKNDRYDRAVNAAAAAQVRKRTAA